ncbi:rab11 family-interacting protein 5 isoform X4 [Scophthalmus maximus]|uniref:rab11 family-interacting protein 5 isoform X4 n=1 Tax=Scophthalmus maximus TaxID=52904 RepID=UPI001FA834A9|nr:rab11 family-interacting protein 5 isoform X4 [Scophthalmus maximus]
MSSLAADEDQQWSPSHVQVTVLRGRGLRGKGKHGTSDVYTIIQLAREKYSTRVAEKTTEPEWREECSFELQPGALRRRSGGGGGAAAGELVLTVMHRALIGLDVFLGQAVVPLDEVFHESRCAKNQWYRLNSKTGKKEKERGDIQVTIQFTRNNLTASMYDLVMKDKGASTFSKLKERMRGKRRSIDDDSSPANLPGGSLTQVRQRLPSDGGGEEDYEDDEGGEARRSKMRTFFLRGKLRKSSDTRSSTSLGSESSESSSRGGSLSPTAGISVVVSDLSNSPSNSSNLTADNSPEHTATTSPSLKCDFGDEVGEITIAVPQPTVCVNGSHAYRVQPLDPGSGKPVDSLGLGLLQKSLPLSVSLQSLSPRASATDPQKGPAGDGRRWSFDKPGEEEKAAIAAALEQGGPMQGEDEERLGTAESESHGKKQKRNLFSHGRSESPGTGPSPSKDGSEEEEKHKGWFGSKDSNSKPSPHPVKPLTTALQAEEKRTEGRSVLATGLEKLKSTIHPGRSSQISEQATDRRKSLTEGAGSYYHLTHSELVALLVQREADLERRKAEFERQRVLLAKREVELRRLKPQVKDLEDYIDTLLVRIMEQKPTLLQVRSKFK